MARPKVYSDALREALLEETSRRLGRDFPEDLSLREIAASQGTSTTAIYTLFGGKNGLILAVLKRAHDDFVEQRNRRVVSTDPLQRLLDLGYVIRAWALANPTLYQTMINVDPHLVGGSSEAALGLFVAAVKEVQTDVENPQSIGDIAYMLWVSLHGWITCELTGQSRRFGPLDEPDPDELFGVYAKGCLRLAFGARALDYEPSPGLLEGLGSLHGHQA